MNKLALLGLILFSALPTTSNYRLNSYGFGSGGTANSHTTTYSLEGTTGELSGQTAATSNNKTKSGFIETQQASVPKLSALDNNGGQYYNKLHFAIDSQNNPTDATYLISVSTVSDFTSNVTYLHPDGTLSAVFSMTDYQTYAAWGGVGGSVMVGLLPSTTYNVRLRATQGKFTESAFGPKMVQTTAAPTLTFSLLTSAQSVPPFSVGLGTLNAGNVNTTVDSINTTLSTNGTSGADVYITGQNGGLKSNSTGSQINAVSNDLSSLPAGFGAQNCNILACSISQTSGGPYSVASPYNGSGNIVGVVSSLTRSLYTSSTPLSGGSGVLFLKAKSATTDVAATDYQEILTFVAAGNF